MSHSKDKRGLTPLCCEIAGCGFSDYFQRHRIKPGRVGGKYRIGNVIALCPNHHAYADNGELGPRDLFETVRDRLLSWLSEGLVTEEIYTNSIAYIEKCIEDLGDRDNFDE